MWLVARNASPAPHLHKVRLGVGADAKAATLCQKGIPKALSGVQVPLQLDVASAKAATALAQRRRVVRRRQAHRSLHPL